MITANTNIIEVCGEVLSVPQYLATDPKATYVVNLTLHELSEEQLAALREYDMVLTTPLGRIFTSTEDRKTWVKEISAAYSVDGRVTFIIGGDTAASMLLASDIVYSRIYPDVLSYPLAHFLYANTERVRDSNDRFVFKFLDWGKFTI
jgi:hypothetical protein